MNVLWFELRLSLYRLLRRKVQNGLMLVTFTVSLALSLLAWTLFHTVFLSEPEFDPSGDYFVMTYADSTAASSRHSSRPEIEAYKAGQTVFSEFAEVALYSSTFIRTPDGSERSLMANLSSRALQILGAKPLLGRLFGPEDDRQGSAVVALLSERMWRSNFGGDPQIVGKTLEETGHPIVIVGVMPASFRFPNDQDLWFSYSKVGPGADFPAVDALVKLKPGVSRRRAEQDLQLILTGLGPQSPANKNGLKPALVPFRDLYLPPDLKQSALILFALSLVFVVVSCANAANLMLIDFFGRRAEVATSLALGVPRGAAARGLCFQVTLIAGAAVVLCLALLPMAGTLLYGSLKVLNGPYWLSYKFAWNDVGFCMGLAALSALTTAMVPVAYLYWSDADHMIREHSTSSRSIGRGAWRRGLLTGQVSLLTVLGVSSALLVRSNFNVGESHRGYAADRVFMGKISNLGVKFDSTSYREVRLALHRKVLEEVEMRPETAAAAFADNTPAYNAPPNCSYAVDPGAFSARAERGQAYSMRASEHFFEVLGVPFVAGATYPKDNPEGGPVYAVINESLAAKLWPGEFPLQRTLYVRTTAMQETDPPMQLTVCGVVRDFQASGPLAKVNDCIYTPFTVAGGVTSTAFLYVHDHAGVPSAPALTATVHRVNPQLTLYFPSTIAAQIETQLSSVRLTSSLTTLFAGAAALLCAIGIYSLTVAQVLQSSRDFGIRMALGAIPRQLWLHFTRGHLLAALIGVVFGLMGASQVVRVLGSLLYGVDPHSITAYSGVALAILVVAALACIPSLFRLRRINPADCLRSL